MHANCITHFTDKFKNYNVHSAKASCQVVENKSTQDVILEDKQSTYIIIGFQLQEPNKLNYEIHGKIYNHCLYISK